MRRTSCIVRLGNAYQILAPQTSAHSQSRRRWQNGRVWESVESVIDIFCAIPIYSTNVGDIIDEVVRSRAGPGVSRTL
jgi:hypothetical protein